MLRWRMTSRLSLSTRSRSEWLSGVWCGARGVSWLVAVAVSGGWGGLSRVGVCPWACLRVGFVSYGDPLSI